jgi:hypothetical protein
MTFSKSEIISAIMTVVPFALGELELAIICGLIIGASCYLGTKKRRRRRV